MATCLICSTSADYVDGYDLCRDCMSDAPEIASASAATDERAHCKGHDMVQVRTLVHPRQRGRLFADAKRAAKQARKILGIIAKRSVVIEKDSGPIAELDNDNEKEADDVKKDDDEKEADDEKEEDEDEKENSSDEAASSDESRLNESDSGSDSEDSPPASSSDSTETEGMTASIISFSDDVKAECYKCSKAVTFPLRFCVICRGKQLYHAN
jgi:hypothetical protein